MYTTKSDMVAQIFTVRVTHLPYHVRLMFAFLLGVYHVCMSHTYTPSPE